MDTIDVLVACYNYEKANGEGGYPNNYIFEIKGDHDINIFKTIILKYIEAGLTSQYIQNSPQFCKLNKVIFTFNLTHIDLMDANQNNDYVYLGIPNILCVIRDMLKANIKIKIEGYCDDLVNL